LISLFNIIVWIVYQKCYSVNE